MRGSWGEHGAGLQGGIRPGVGMRREGATVAGGPARGAVHHGAVTLSKGVSRDADFESWAASALGGRPVGMPLPRKDVVIEAFDEAGHLLSSYRVVEAWVSEYQAAPDLDAGASSVTIEHMKLENEGIEIVTP